tara:strand:+ start:132 stop:1028 length:897 start_codon:yes stop_codon:yes gene_type:complete
VIKELILLTGGNGQLGCTFSEVFNSSGLIKGYELQAVDIEDINFLNREEINTALSFYAPSVIVNCGAYTAVDQAEKDFELVEKINGEAVADMAEWARKEKSRLIQVSTDFVFDGAKRTPYLPSDLTNPLGVYGKTKLKGEKYILDKLPHHGVVIRTSWLYSEFCSNFVKSMLDLMSEKNELRIVSDQLGSPTSTHSLVEVLFKIIDNKSVSGIFHWCDGGEISWFDFAIEIQEQAFELGILEDQVPIRAIDTSAYPTLARRPAYSVLDRRMTIDELRINETIWKNELRKVIAKIASAG